ncbi:7,8-dihydroneopterin aldolase [Bacteroidota bacterium]|nr:7,8-dihydroneopterin aldolase [Bacteroidota bacterium]
MGKRIMQVKLEQVNFYAYHGLYPAEAKIGGQFLVDLTVAYSIQDEITTSINSLLTSVDYVSLYTIVKERMSIPTALLETVVMDIVASIRSSFPQVNLIEIKLTKIQPPIPGMQGNTAVQFRWEV